MSMTAMAKLYIQKIMDGKITIEDVPVRWREEVREALENG